MNVVYVFISQATGQQGQGGLALGRDTCPPWHFLARAAHGTEDPRVTMAIPILVPAHSVRQELT